MNSRNAISIKNLLPVALFLALAAALALLPVGNASAASDNGDGGSVNSAVYTPAPEASPPATILHLRVRPSRTSARSASASSVRFWVSTDGAVDFTLRRLSRKGLGVKVAGAKYTLESSQSESLTLGMIFPRTVTSELRGRYRLVAQVEGSPASWAQNAFRVTR